MRPTLRIRTPLVRALTRAAVAGALILGIAPMVAHAADGAAGPATPLTEPLTQFVSEQTPVLEMPPPEQAAPVAETPPPAPPAAEIPPAVEPAPVEPPVAEPTPTPPPVAEPTPTPPPVAEPTPTPPVTEAQTPPVRPTPGPVAGPPTEAAPTPGGGTSGPVTPTEIGAPGVDEATAVPVAPPGEILVPPPADPGAVVGKPSDTVKRADTIKTSAPTELISSTAVAPLASTTPATSARDALTETTTGATSRATPRRSGGDETFTAAAPVAATTAPVTAAAATAPRTAPAGRMPISDGFRLAAPLQPALGEQHARPAVDPTPLPRRSTKVETRTSQRDGVFSARIEAPMSAVMSGSSFLAVLASYALPGSGPVPLSLALVMFAQLAIMLGAMRAPRVHLSERLVILGLLAGDAGHRRAVQRPG